MKLLALIALSIGFLCIPSSLLAQVNSAQSETRQSVKSIQDSVLLSREQKLNALNALLQQENTKSDLNSDSILILKTNIARLMKSLGQLDEIRALFETSDFLKDLNKTNDNINEYFDFLTLTANAYMRTGEYNNAKKLIAELQSYLPSYEITDKHQVVLFLAAASLHVRKREYIEGVAILQRAIEIIENSSSFSEKNKLQRASIALSYIGNIYYALGAYNNAIKYYERAIDKLDRFPSLDNIVAYNHNIASAKLELSEWEKAFEIATLASQQAQDHKKEGFFAYATEIIARAQHGLGNSAEAIKKMHTAIDIYRKLNNTQKVTEALAYQAEFHISLGNWDEARQNTMEAHSILENSNNQLKPTIELLNSSFLIEEHNNNLDKAAFYQKQLSKLMEEDSDAKKEQDVQRLMFDLEINLAEEKSLRLENENKLKSMIIEKNESKHVFFIAVISGSIIALVLLVSVFIRERNLKIKMSHLAMTDDLTGCPNRRNAMYQAKGMLTNQVGKKESMIIAILDVDNFKAINDTYGHDVGDKALQNLSSVITTALRDTDVIGRYGGEEFMLLMPRAGKKEITMIFSRVQTALKSHTCEYNGEKIALPITVSIGACVVSHVPEKLGEHERKLLLSDIIKIADDKAYEAKKDGKDQLKLA